jgi:type I restriction enzyme S subunit
MTGSSGRQRVQTDVVKEHVFDAPELAEQRAIASILSSLDDKIDLLHRQNHTLEQMAETLFRQWFPPVGGQGVEEADDSWEIGTLNDVLTVKGGTTPSTKNPDYWDGDIHWTSPRDITTLNSIYLFDTERKITEAGLKKISSGLLPKGTLLMSSRAPVGVLAFAEVPIAINQGYIAILDDKGLSKEFLFLWLKTNMDYVQSYANGSTFLEISKSAFKSLGIQIPSKDLRNEFQEWVTPHFKKIKSNQTQIRTLTALRDTLLPKLMSGEIRLNYYSDDFYDSCDSNNQINQTNQKNHSSDK